MQGPRRRCHRPTGPYRPTRLPLLSTLELCAGGVGAPWAVQSPTASAAAAIRIVADRPCLPGPALHPRPASGRSQASAAAARPGTPCSPGGRCGRTWGRPRARGAARRPRGGRCRRAARAASTLVPTAVAAAAAAPCPARPAEAALPSGWVAAAVLALAAPTALRTRRRLLGRRCHGRRGRRCWPAAICVPRAGACTQSRQNRPR
mmetsp:Transcript_36103/g.114783  ORF Transcript_36103/g.114783 Transcript_36103/m.114783 type:complete len:205 (-) Transcript_36103:172-786(-)